MSEINYLIPEPLYSQCLAVFPRACVDIVVRCRGKILLLKRTIEPRKGEWALPGGGISKGWEPKTMASWKLAEEISLKSIEPDMLKLLCVVSYVHPNRHDICITYGLELAEYPQLHLDFQHSECGWFEPDQLPETTFENAREQIASLIQ